MIDWKLQGGIFVFNLQESEDSIDFQAILCSLTDNGIGKQEGAVFTIPADGIYELSGGQRRLLNLPQEYPYYLKIDSDGLINRPGFKYVPQFYLTKGRGRMRCESLSLPIVDVMFPEGESLKYILTKPQYDVIAEINSVNGQEFVDSTTSYHCLAKIKEFAAADSHIFFTDFLQGLNVVALEHIHLHLDYKDEKLTVSPDIPEELREKNDITQGEFTRAFDQRNQVIPVYTIRTEDGKGEHKVVLPEQSAPKLSDVKKAFSAVQNQETIRDVVENPQTYFDESLFDLKEFYSDRVIEIGLYKPKFYAFISPYKSEWIPGFTIEDKYNGNTNVILKVEEEIQEFEAAIKEAEERKSSEISYKGYKLDYEEAKNILKIARKQNANPTKRLEVDENKKKVLIIEENAESLGYKVDTLDIDAPDVYNFHSVDALKDGIELKTHQREGVAWLQHLVRSKDKGCLLADDMGLGKTLQVLYFIQWHRQYCNKDKKPYLIVAPVSLLDNWSKEISKFIKDTSLEPTVLHGDLISKKRNDSDIEWLKTRTIILTNYETVRSYQFNICAVDYAVVVLDEAQKIKTPGTYITCASKALKADFKIAMTGTPVENTFLDLWCIMDFAIPGLLGNAKGFAAKYQHPLKKEGTDVEALGKELRNQMGVFFMRRCKTDVLKDLPEKTEEKTEVVMCPTQEGRYLKAIRLAQDVLADGNGSAMLELIYKLRRISESPYVADETADIESVSINDLIDSSAKVQATLDILHKIKEKDEKAIIFCIYKESQRMLQRIISSRFGITPKIINGDTKVMSSVRYDELNYSRQQAIDNFEAQDGFNVIIMSPIAAGMGLNVTAANHVIHFGRHWNPAKESQATDRAYRIGQQKPVTVYYPITVLSDKYKFHSFDQTLDELLRRKMNLADATLFPTEQSEVRVSDFKEMIESSTV